MKALRENSAETRFMGLCVLVLHLGLGVAIGFLLHYALYRLSLPVQPFIYVAF
jgi:hypothetical protein